MYSKQLLEDVNKVVNPAFVGAIDFDKLNEAIENNQLINLDLLVEGAEGENSIKKSLMKILGTKVIPAVMLGAALLASGNASARCSSADQNDGRGTVQHRCLTIDAVKQITAYEQEVLSKVPAAERNFFHIKSAEKILIDNKPAFVGSDGDAIYAVRVKSKAGTYYALMDFYKQNQKNGIFLLTPDFDGRFVYLLSAKKQLDSSAITKWTLLKTIKFSELGPVTKKYLNYLEPIVRSGLTIEKYLKQEQEPEPDAKYQTRGLKIK